MSNEIKTRPLTPTEQKYTYAKVCSLRGRQALSGICVVTLPRRAMAFTPLGYIKLPGLTITFLTIPVAVGAIILGPVGGLICGLTFGLTSLYQAVTGGSVFTLHYLISACIHYYSYSCSKNT